MATIKAYTDLEQSKVLARILPIESSDMYWDLLSRDKFARVNNIGYCLCRSCVYAWSLAALLGVLPDYTLQDNPNGTVFVVSEKEKPIMSDDYDNPVDACVAMIEKLHELNLL